VFVSAPLFVELEPPVDEPPIELPDDELPEVAPPDVEPPALEPLDAANAGAAASIRAETATASFAVLIVPPCCGRPPPSGGGQRNYGLGLGRFPTWGDDGARSALT
jgi:hypothetical protein